MHSPSHTLMAKNEDFLLQVARGQIKGHRAIFRSAYSDNVTNAQNYAVWNRAANYTFPAAAALMTISSSAVGDVGQTVLVEGLDANYAEISEVLTLNGQTGVSSTQQFLRINGMTVISGSPSGSIYFGTGSVTTGVPANVYGFIYAGDNAMLAAFYTVPAKHKLYILGGSMSCSLANANKQVTVSFNSRISGLQYKTAPIKSGGGFQHYPYLVPLEIPAQTDLLDTATTTDSSATSSVVVNLSGVLIETDPV